MKKIMGLLFIVAMGVQGFDVFPSIAARTPHLQPDQSLTSHPTQNSTMTRETAKENPWGVRYHMVRRESAGPPGESRSGRVSSSPVNGITESSRKSSAPLDPGADDAEKQIQGEKTESRKEIGTTRKHRRDSSEGGGQSHPVIKKRSGVID